MEKKDLEGAEVSAYDNFSKPGPSNEKLAPAGSDVATKDMKGNSAYDNFSKPGPSNEKLAPAGSDVAEKVAPIINPSDNIVRPEPPMKK